jgi:S-methylmethionine-dependent homocysteine/selenocysteine methylase
MGNRLPQLAGDIWMTDGGLETSIIFDQGIELPDFAAFPLLDGGRAVLDAYFRPYLDLARDRRLGMVVDTPTWRANPDWATRLGFSAEDLIRLNEDSVRYVRGLLERAGVDGIVNGAIGPRGDGYVVGDTMSAAEAARYHALQVRAFAEAGADMVTGVTMTYAEEAIGIVEASRAAGIPVAISFTVETDGRLPSGQTLADAVEEVDLTTGSAAAYFMVNCAHPTHFRHILDQGGPWLERVRGVRANASRASHAELDAAEELDRGDPRELAGDYASLRRVVPHLSVVGGCCGTDHEHIAAITEALVPA